MVNLVSSCSLCAETEKGVIFVEVSSKQDSVLSDKLAWYPIPLVQFETKQKLSFPIREEFYYGIRIKQDQFTALWAAYYLGTDPVLPQAVS